MSKLQAQGTLHCLLEGFLLGLRGRGNGVELGQTKSQLLVVKIECTIDDFRQWHCGSIH
jgi:hypothetical protein